MATVVVLSVFAVACLFMVYVLIEFHLEAKRPRRAPSRVPNGVIVFRGKFAGTPCGRVVARQSNPLAAPSPPHKLNNQNPVVLPLGIRRLTAKRAIRN